MALADVVPFQSAVGVHMLAVDGSRIYDIDRQSFARLLSGEIPDELQQLMIGADGRFVDDAPVAPQPIRALSLNVAQSCNLACTYCYADSGKFGRAAQLMSAEIALAAVDRLLAETGPGSDAVLGFMGGEPLLNRRLLRDIVPEASRRAEAADVRLRFSITTNATLIRPEDVQLFSDYPFTVTVSLDGDRTLNDRQRPTAAKGGSFDAAVAGLERLAAGSIRHLSIRATVTPRAVDLPATLDFLLRFGVDEVGFAPVLVSPDPAEAFAEEDFEGFLQKMIACGEAAKAALLERRRYKFSNFETALHEINRGTHRPYPCGAAANYASISADGGIYACHRAVGDRKFAIGHLASGPDEAARRAFLEDRHVSNQAPCVSCWARQLCGGGCHQEVIKRGRIACDYIRGWLLWCLGAYAEISELRPSYFTDPTRFFLPDTAGEKRDVR